MKPDNIEISKVETSIGKRVPIVAIGASAGGLEAIVELLQHAPDDSGMAFVYIQHLDPEYESNLDTILGRATKMPVAQAEENMKILPNHVYVIPPDKELFLVDGSIKTSDRPQRPMAQMPVNRFFASLADNYKEASIGVILSGTANDGTLGMIAIKEAGGFTFAQDDSARFQSMPRSAIAEGAVDLVLSPKDIAQEINNIARHKNIYYGALAELREDKIGDNDEELHGILTVLNRSTGVDFTQYKMNTIKRRIIRRMMLFKMENLEAYASYIKQHNNEVNHLYQDLLINVTTFFRDPETCGYLKTVLFPQIIKSKTSNDPIRIWVTACSTGQEVYSMAMLLLEVLGENAVNTPIQIFATDLSENAINKARIGIYSKSDLEDVSAERLQRFFTRTDGSYRIIKLIRDLCIFAVHNIAKDPPFSRLDLVSCCNLLIYLNSNLQKKIIATFHYSLGSNGHLILGKSETVGNSAYLFSHVDKKLKIYAKKKDATSRPMFEMNYRSDGDKPESFDKRNHKEAKKRVDETDLEEVVKNLLLKKYTPASVIVNADLDILQFRGSTGLFLEPSPGKASLNLLKMARQGLGFELRNIVHKAKKTKEPARKAGLEVTIDKKLHQVAIEAIPLKDDSTQECFLVVFEEMITPAEHEALHAGKDRRVKQLESELNALREDMRSIVESQEAANEELQSANEEIVSSNEELQSINEELETSKEEIESSNEELITINQELQVRNDQLAQSQEYSETIFSIIRESLLILDKDLRIKNANDAFYRTFGLKEQDVEGKLVYELERNQWDIPRLRELLEDIIPTNSSFYGFEITHVFPGMGEKNLVLNARKVVHRLNAEPVILIAIEDVTEQKKTQLAMFERQEWFHNIADNSPVMIYVTGVDRLVTFFNKTWADFCGTVQGNGLGKHWTDCIHPDDRERCKENFDSCFTKRKPFEMLHRMEKHKEGYKWVTNKANPNFSTEGQFVGYIGSCVETNEPV